MPSQNAEVFLQTLIKLIKEERVRLKISQDQLAQRSGVDRGSISRLERLERIPSILALYDLAEGLGTPLQDFIAKAHRKASR